MRNYLGIFALSPIVVTLIACGGSSSTDPLASPLNDVEVSQPQPVQTTAPVGQEELAQVLGLWHCATAWYDGTEYRTAWDESWQMNFNSDMTVNITGSTGSFWQTGESIVVQTEDGRTSEFGFNVDGRDGIASDNTHCLRELPVENL